MTMRDALVQVAIDRVAVTRKMCFPVLGLAVREASDCSGECILYVCDIDHRYLCKEVTSLFFVDTFRLWIVLVTIFSWQPC